MSEEMNELVSTEMNSDQLRTIQEAQAAIIIAQKFPRDEIKRTLKIQDACKRHSLAEVAFYSYPKGGTTVTGVSIHLAKTLAMNWGNLQFGIRELSQRNGESLVESYCWDMERNYRPSIIFTVKHERHSKDKRTREPIVTKITDPREVYELVANYAARRLRKCILDCIPEDVIEMAKNLCNETLKKGDGVSMKDRIVRMLGQFQEQGVTKEMIEKKVGHNLEAISPIEIVNLQKIFISLRDGASQVTDWFTNEVTNAIESDEQLKAKELSKKLLTKKEELKLT